MGLGGTGTPPSIMVAPLHQVCTGISGKVQTKMPAEMERIALLEVHRERYTDQSAHLHHLHKDQRASLQGQVTRAGVPVKSALVQTSR